MQKYIVDRNPELLGGATAADLWGARCGVLHTGAAESNDFRKGDARRIYYSSNCGQVESEDPTILILSLEWLGSAFAAALVWFLNDLENNPVKDARAREKLARMLVDQQP